MGRRSTLQSTLLRKFFWILKASRQLVSPAIADTAKGRILSAICNSDFANACRTNSGVRPPTGARLQRNPPPLRQTAIFKQCVTELARTVFPWI